MILSWIKFEDIDKFTITCAGCKIQITNSEAWGSVLRHKNVHMMFPKTNEVGVMNADYSELQSGLYFELPSEKFCNYTSRSCHLIVKNNEKLPPSNSSIHRWRLFSDDSLDIDFYPFPTIDLMIKERWAGELVINSNAVSSKEHHPTVVVPFAFADNFLALPIYPSVTKNEEGPKGKTVQLPSLSLNCESAKYPIFFNGHRGGRYRNVTVNCFTGSFVARHSEFVKDSVVKVSLPQGDIMISANQRIETTVSSIYSATPPSIPSLSGVGSADELPVSVHDMSNAKLSISVTGYNFRSMHDDDFKLLVPNGTCLVNNSAEILGLGMSSTVGFVCDFSYEIKSTGEVSGQILIQYFGGNTVRTGYGLSFSAYFGQTAYLYSPKVFQWAQLLPPSQRRQSSGVGCGSDYLSPGHVCAVASSDSLSVPSFVDSDTLDNAVILLPVNNTMYHYGKYEPFTGDYVPFASRDAFKFRSSFVRSLSLGSYIYTPGLDDQQHMKSIVGCKIFYDGEGPSELNPEYNIPYDAQLKLESALKALTQNNVSVVIIKTLGSGTNLPGYFILTKRKIFTVIDPTIIQTLSFGLLPISILAVDVSASSFFQCSIASM